MPPDGEPVLLGGSPYRYARNDPINRVDPSGLFSEGPDDAGDISGEAPDDPKKVPALGGPPEKAFTVNLRHIPIDTVDGLVEDKIATSYTRYGRTVVVSPFLIEGKTRQIVLLKQRDRQVIPPIGPGGAPTIVGTGGRVAPPRL